MQQIPFPNFGKNIEAGVLRGNVNAGLDFPVQVMNQVHGADIWEVEGYGTPRECDAMISRVPGVKLMVRTADCIPLVLAGGGVVAAVHAGWRSLVADIIPKTIAAMGVDPAQIKVGIGPSLGFECSEFSDPENEIPEKYHWAIEGDRVDLNLIADRQLEDAGVLAENIHRMEICTKCDPEWFSWRRDKTEERFGTWIMML